MKCYEEQYCSILKDIMENGTEELNERTGVKTKRLANQIIQVDLQKEFPILRSRQVFWKSAIEEILWIMQAQSNNIKDLRPHIWDKWASEDGSIGKSYGYQVSKPVHTTQGGVNVTYDSQVHYVLQTLKRDPSDRRCVINLWDCEELSEMNLNPCCFSSVWNLDGGKLNCLLTQRSGDYPVGVVFNTTQYAALTILFANELKVEPGNLLHVIADAHIYENQYEGAYKILDNYEKLSFKMDKPAKLVAPHKRFWDVTIEDILLENYEHMGKINFEVTK